MKSGIVQENDKQIMQLAEKSFLKRNFVEVVRQLAPQIFLFRNSRRYYYLIGVSSLWIGDFSGAHSYLLRAKDLDPLNMDIHLGLAISHLSRKEETEALRIWVGIQDSHPNSKKTIKALELLKQAGDKVDWLEQLRLGKLKTLYPEPGFDWSGLSRRLVLVVGSVAILGIAIFWGIQGIAMIGKSWATNDRAQVLARDSDKISAQAKGQTPGETATSTLEDFGFFSGDTPRFILSPGEIDSTMVTIRDLFRKYQDNPARILLNRLMQSNAPLPIKEQLRGLSVHFREPGFANFRDNYDFSQVAFDPLLYQGVFVKWRGKIAELINGETIIQGVLLLDYEKGKVIRAAVPFELGFPANLHNDQAVEIIAKIFNDRTHPGQFTLRTTSLRMIREGTVE